MHFVPLPAFADDHPWLHHDGAHSHSPLRLALADEPDNREIVTHIAGCVDERASNHPSRPSTIGMDRRLSPLWRDRVHAAAAPARGHVASSDQPVAARAALRE